MRTVTSRPADQWSPLYFLASVGAGGLAVTFFMYLMFWIPHPGRPVPIFEDIAASFSTASPALGTAIVIAVLGIAVFGAMNLYYLAWNLRRTRGFQLSDRGIALASSNGQTQMMAMPLAFAMSVNVGFILGLVFVPGLWNVVEYLFPAALAAFTIIGVLALRQLGGFVARVIGSGGFDCRANNSFAQLLPAFTLAMVGVGLSAPGAMSGTALTAGISIVLSTFFLVSAAVIAAIGIVLGLRAMLENGVAVEQSPTLLIAIPLITVLGILLLRQDHGLHVHFDGHGAAGDMLVLLTRLLSVQVLFALFGLTVLRASGYIRRFVTGHETSPGSYALICPGVALSVMLQFWINKGLVGAGLVAKFGAAYWTVTGFALVAQVGMVVLMLVLNQRHFGRGRQHAVPAA
ncbi:TsoY family (seleno)protein [Halovulum sp. GXIMD14794]